MTPHPAMLALLIAAACEGVDATDDVDPTPTETEPPDDTDVPIACERFIPPAPRAQGEPVLVAEILDGTTRWEACLVVEDLDNDGWVDLLTAEVEAVHLRWGSADGWTTARHPFPEGVRLPQQTTCVAHDLDQDGRMDVAIATATGAASLTFAGRAPTFDPGLLLLDPPPAIGINHLVWVDLDGDGAEELIVGEAGRLEDQCVALPDDPGDTDVVLETAIVEASVRCLAQGPGGWVEAPSLCPAALREPVASNTYAIQLFDVEGDGRVDAWFGNDFGVNVYVKGTPQGWVLPAAYTGLEVYDHAMGNVLADFDLDGLRDLYVTDVGPNSVYIANGCDQWFDQSYLDEVAGHTDRTITWGAAGSDLDLDGDEDIVTTVSAEVGPGDFAHPFCDIVALGLPTPHDLVLDNRGDGTFRRHEVPLPPDEPRWADWHTIATAAGDLDRDGDQDVATVGASGLRVLWNRSEPMNDHLAIRPLDPSGSPSLGARVIVLDSGGRRMKETWGTHGLSGHSQRLAHFGVLAREGLEVRVRWLDGASVHLTDVAAGQTLDVPHP
jgi:hypothetical protein